MIRVRTAVAAALLASALACPLYAQDAVTPTPVATTTVEPAPTVETAAAAIPAEAVKAPVVTTVVERRPEWISKLLDAVISAGVVVATTMVAVLGTAARGYLARKSRTAAALYDQILGDKLEKGAIGIITSEAEQFKARLGMGTGPGAPPMVLQPDDTKAIITAAQPKFREAYKESLSHFGKSEQQITDYLYGRVDQALNKTGQLPPHLQSYVKAGAT